MLNRLFSPSVGSVVQLVKSPPLTNYICVRCMASRRGHYIRGASNRQDISQETKELLRNAKNPEEPAWRLGHGIKEPITMDLSTEERKRARQYIVPYFGRAGVTELASDDVISYYPPKDDDCTPPAKVSPVLMVKRIKSLAEEPWYNKLYCEQIGIGRKHPLRCPTFLPNLPSVSLLLFKIKHLVEIIPVTFPHGIPENFNPEKDGCHLKPNGEFVVDSSYKVDTDDIVQRAKWIKLDPHQISREAARKYRQPRGTVLGNHNYYKDSRWMDNDAADTEYAKNAKKKY